MKIKNKPKTVRIINSGVLCLALMFSLMAMGNSTALEGVSASPYFGLSLLCMGIYELLSFFCRRKTEPKKRDFFYLGYFALCFAAMVCAYAIPDTSGLYVLPPVLYLIVPIAKRIVAIATKRKKRSVIYNSLVLVVCALALLSTVALMGYIKEGQYGSTPIFACMIITMTCLTNICMMAFSQLNKEILLRIVHKTYAGEIILGLFLLVVAFSLVLLHNEESVKTFGDALWYCFAVVSTIGFGDIAAVSMVGRILTVILGVYGIIVVSILTSIIVNFYSEVKDTKDDEPEDEDEPSGEDGKDSAATTNEGNDESTTDMATQEEASADCQAQPQTPQDSESDPQ